MYRWLLILTLSTASTAASGQAVQPQAQQAATDRAATGARDAEARVVRLAARRAELAQRYQEELDAIDRLKNQRASWRRDRELRDSLSTSLETANQLSAATRELEAAKTALATARRAYLGAIAGELGAGPPAPRTVELSRARSVLAAQVKDAPRRIVIPDLDVDPLADPEELDQRAAELRASEDELARQLVGLDSQAGELERLALLRKQHERAGEIFNRDDDQPHRNTTRKAGDPAVAPDDGTSSGWDSTHLPTAPGTTPSTFDTYVPVVLADVIDASTINSFAAAQRSGDPAQRAEAARKARDAVAGRLEQVKKRRTEIEARAQRLRGKR